MTPIASPADPEKNPNVHFVAGAPSEASKTPTPASRTPQDYAIEHAEYMAMRGDQLLEAIEALSAAEVKREDADEDTPELEGAFYDARDQVWSSVRRLNAAIYEFRKRRDRAALAAALPSQRDAISDEEIEAVYIKTFNESRDTARAAPKPPPLVFAFARAILATKKEG